MGLLVVTSLALAGYSSFCVYLYFAQAKYIFKPDRVVDLQPADLQLTYEEVWFGDHQALHGWWLPAITATAISRNSPHARVLIYLHGNSENISGNLRHAHRFQQMGFNVLLFDYRGYGLSQGDFPSEKNLFADADDAWAYVTKDRQWHPSQIWIYGHSLGGAVAIDLATKQPDAAGLIAESTFSSMQAAIQETAYYRYVPIKWLLRHRFDSIAKVPQLKIPVLYIHGLGDETIPAFMSQELFTASPDPKELWLVPAADHNNVADLAGDTYFRVVKDFINFQKIE